MSQRILVINPNSTQAVTDGIDRALEPLRLQGGPSFECVTLREGPPGIQSQRDVDGVIGPLTQLIAGRDTDCAAFVIACYSDPGLFSAREVTRKPVLGISECGVLTALTLGQRFGVIAILAQSIPRHLRYLGAMGVTDRLAAELPVGLQVTELADAARTKQKMIDTGKRLVQEHGAHVVVMGCAGMAQYRAPLEDALGVPVVEPTQAAAGMALVRVRLGGGGGHETKGRVVATL
jgi:allantoin racemase